MREIHQRKFCHSVILSLWRPPKLGVCWLSMFAVGSHYHRCHHVTRSKLNDVDPSPLIIKTNWQFTVPKIENQINEKLLK